jgi:hypothetical protein
MTDEELARELTKLAELEPFTNAGVMAMFALAERVQKERPEFAGPPRMVLNSRSFTGEVVVQRMLSLYRDGTSASDAVAWLRRVTAATRVEGGALKLLYGVTCDERVDLAEDIVLLPLAKVPESDTLKWVIDEHHRANDARLMHGFTALPGAGLYRAGTLEPLFRTGSPDRPFEQPPTSWFFELDSAALLLALSPKAVAVEVSRWFHCDDRDLDLLVQSGLTRQQEEFYSPFRAASAPTPIEPTAVAGSLTRYRELGVKHQQRITLALQRLLKSRAQLKTGNRAIDLAIALEVLFMNRDQGEHSYKISLRLAQLLGGSLTERRAAFAEARAVYEIRSSTVHTGTTDGEIKVAGEKRNVHELVEAVDLRCTLAVRKFLEIGKIPDDWRDIELGFGPPPNPGTSP